MGHWSSTRLEGYPSGGYRAWWNSAPGCIALGVLMVLVGLSLAFDRFATLRLIGVSCTVGGAAVLARGFVLRARRRRQVEERRAAISRRDPQDPDLLPDLPPVPPPYHPGAPPKTDGA